MVGRIACRFLSTFRAASGIFATLVTRSFSIGTLGNRSLGSSFGGRKWFWKWFPLNAPPPLLFFPGLYSSQSSFRYLRFSNLFFVVLFLSPPFRKTMNSFAGNLMRSLLLFLFWLVGSSVLHRFVMTKCHCRSALPTVCSVERIYSEIFDEMFLVFGNNTLRRYSEYHRLEFFYSINAFTSTVG